MIGILQDIRGVVDMPNLSCKLGRVQKIHDGQHLMCDSTPLDNTNMPDTIEHKASKKIQDL